MQELIEKVEQWAKDKGVDKAESCEYCNGELLFGNADPWVEVEIMDGKLDICTDEMRVKITINCCPMCGERLEVTE